MPSISQILRDTRARLGVSLEEVAQRTYIKLPYLVALEEGHLDRLPAAVYIHGYIRQYAKLLGLDGNELVSMYQEELNGMKPHTTSSTAYDEQVRRVPESDPTSPRSQAQNMVVAAQREAQEMRISAERYADQVLGQLENDVSRALQIVRNGRLFIQSKRRRGG